MNLFERKASSHPKLFSGLASIAVLAGWEALVRLAGIPSYLLPPPSAIGRRVVTSSALIGSHSLVTLAEVLLGFLSGTILGFVLAAAIVHSRALERAVMPAVLFLQTMPKLAIAPLLLIWLGYGVLPKIVVATLMCVFPILINCVSGLQLADPRLLDLMKVLGASRWQVLWKVRFPGALPQIFAAAKVAITLSVVGAIVGEWVGSSAGLGHLILIANAQLDTELVFACIAILSAMGSALFYAVQGVERRYLSWSTPIQTQGAL